MPGNVQKTLSHCSMVLIGLDALDQPVFDENAMEAILNVANGTVQIVNKIYSRSLMVGASHA